MNQEEAQAEAKRLYGPAAFASVAKHGAFDIQTTTPHAGITCLLGWGKTWEEAFTLAAVRAEWHTIDEHGARLKVDRHDENDDTEEKPEVPKTEPEQLPLL